LASASPEGIAKLWDLKSGKSTADLKAHTKRCYWAAYNSVGTQLVTCGSDRAVYLWDLKNTKQPLLSNKESDSIILSCDFLSGDEYIVATTLEGEINILSVNDKFNQIRHETLSDNNKSNIVFCSHAIKDNVGDEAGTFLVGTEGKAIEKY